MSDLPNGWKIATIADVTDYISRGKSPKYTDLSSLPVVNQKAIRWFGIQKEYLKYVHPDQFDSWAPERYIQEGDILWNSTGTGTIGRACLVSKENLEPPKVVDSHVTIVRPNKASIESSYLFAWIRSSEVQDTIASLYSGSTNQVELNRATIAATQIPLAPLNEQKRIADKLDALLARVDACRERLDRVPLILKRFRQAVLVAATSGELTEGWRQENFLERGIANSELEEKIRERRMSVSATKRFKEPLAGDLTHWSIVPPESWTVASTSSFAECLDHMRIPVKREDRKSFEGIYPYFGANGLVDMVDEYIFDDELVLVTEDETFYGREKPIAYRFSGKCWVNNHAHVIRTSDKSSADYLCYCLMYYDVLPWLTGTTGRAKLTQAVLNSLPIAVPPKQEMDEIVRRVETLFALADRLETRYKTARAQVEQLTAALLAKAFCGELVPQDPNDEPASMLLERIREARVVAEEDEAKLRRRKTDKPSKAEVIVSERKEVQPSHLSDVLTTRDPLTAEALFSVSQLELKIDDSAV